MAKGFEGQHGADTFVTGTTVGVGGGVSYLYCPSQHTLRLSSASGQAKRASNFSILVKTISW